MLNANIIKLTCEKAGLVNPLSENLVLHVVGTRPNIVKLSVVYFALKNICEQIIIHTGQHYDYELSKVFF
ncbi:MAG: hypothetical protein QXM43_09435 [Desulfurococcaceae archaeon]